MLNKKDLQELIEVARQHINLPAAVIEKDYYVTQTIHALSNIESECFRLVFAGGTCLAKAHKIVNRMSEDIDFKIEIKKDNNFSRSRLIKELKEFRSKMKSSLIVPGLTVSEDLVCNEGKYQRVILKYPCSSQINSTLRPDLLLEFTLSDIRFSIENLSVKTIIESVLKEITLFSSPQTQCVSIGETAIEKWVGLTRRIIAIEREYHHDDPTLVRHIYDLNAIKQAEKINADFVTLAKSIVNNDAKQFKNQHPEYSADPSAEISRSLTLLKNKPLWKKRYQEFIETMVYDSIAIQDYVSAIKNLDNLSKTIIASLTHPQQ